MTRIGILIASARTGSGCFMRSRPRRSDLLTDREHELAVRAAELFRLDVAGVDLLRSASGPLVIEVNANPGFLELERVTGVDVAGAIVELATNLP